MSDGQFNLAGQNPSQSSFATTGHPQKISERKERCLMAKNKGLPGATR